MARTVHLALTDAQNSNSTDTALFNELLHSCAPATFGRKDKDILDESYRKAGKLDRSQFSVDFHPHDYGIIDAISQILLPETSTAFLIDRQEHRGMGTVSEGMNCQPFGPPTLHRFSFLFQASNAPENITNLTLEQMFQDAWPHARMRNLTWLNSTNGQGINVAIVNITYGNQAEMAWHYSHAVIPIEVPKRGQRLGF